MNRISVRNLVIVLSLLAITVTLGPKSAWATPTLQVDIEGGTYNTFGTVWSDETVVSNQDGDVIVNALGISSGNYTVTDQIDYKLAIALVPKLSPPVPPGTDLGSFTVGIGNGAVTTINVTADMVFGVPPVEALIGQDPGDLAQHGIYETWFAEVVFNFSTDYADTYDVVNVQDTPGTTYTQSDSRSMYVQDFVVNISGLADGFGLHFDLYDTTLTGTDVDINKFAPFSHDAELRDPETPLPAPTPIPEPASLAIWSMMALGTAGIAASRRRRRRDRWSENHRQAILSIIEQK